jgi:hypothetical protein
MSDTLDGLLALFGQASDQDRSDFFSQLLPHLQPDAQVLGCLFNRASDAEQRTFLNTLFASHPATANELREWLSAASEAEQEAFFRWYVRERVIPRIPEDKLAEWGGKIRHDERGRYRRTHGNRPLQTERRGHMHRLISEGWPTESDEDWGRIVEELRRINPSFVSTRSKQQKTRKQQTRAIIKMLKQDLERHHPPPSSQP